MEQIQNNITRYYLIDYENVHQAGLNGIEDLDENNIIVIFYTENAETLTFSLYEKLVRCKAEIQLYKVDCGGKNALDFQLATFLGYVLGNNPDTDCHIISNDKGYEYIAGFWRKKDIEVKILSDVSGNVQKLSPVVIEVQENKTETDFDRAVKPLNLSRQEKSKLCSIFYSMVNISDKDRRLLRLQQIITKHFGEENAVRYYAALEPLLK